MKCRECSPAKMCKTCVEDYMWCMQLITTRRAIWAREDVERIEELYSKLKARRRRRHMVSVDLEAMTIAMQEWRQLEKTVYLTKTCPQCGTDHLRNSRSTVNCENCSEKARQFSQYLQRYKSNGHTSDALEGMAEMYSMRYQKGMTVPRCYTNYLAYKHARQGKVPEWYIKKAAH